MDPEPAGEQEHLDLTYAAYDVVHAEPLPEALAGSEDSSQSRRRNAPAPGRRPAPG